MVDRDDNSNESPASPKRTGNCSYEDERVDRISGLPDHVLLEILSFMPMKDAVKTGVLSKRWEFLWTSVLDLDFHHPKPFSYHPDNKPEDNLLHFIDRTLFFYKGSKIRKVRIDFHIISDWFAPYLDKWIRFVVRKKVEEFDLDLYYTSEYYDLYELPPHIYNIASLKKLRLKFCHFKPLRGPFSWRLLTSLSLVHIDLSDDLMQDILSGSPSLEVLDLHECSYLMHLNITSPNLKKLMVGYDYSGALVSDSVLEISAPNLQSLAILGEWSRSCRLINLQCLVHATLDFEVVTDYGFSDRHIDSEELDNILREFFGKLHHVKDLTIGPWCIQLCICLIISGLMYS